MSIELASPNGPPWHRIWRIAVFATIAAVALYCLARIPLTVEVFIVATLLAYGIDPIVRRLSRRMPRMAAVGFVYLLLVLAILLIGFVIVPDTVDQLQAFFSNSGYLVNGVQSAINGWQAWIVTHFGARVLPAQFQEIEKSALAQATATINDLVRSAGNLLVGIASDIVVGITAVVLSYYFLTHVDEIRTSFYSLFPDRAKAGAHRVGREVSRVIGGFFVGQILLCAFTGVGTWLVLYVAGSDYALLLGAIAGLLYAVPFLGLVVALLLGLMLGSMQGWPMALLTFAVILIVAKISDILLVPKIMAQSVGVSPMAVIFAIFAGGELFGIWGLVLAIPAAALVKLAWNLWLHPWITGQPPLQDDVAVAKSALPAASPSRSPAAR